jgi:Fe-S-cluster formation regulator IscX/YfhJ
MHASLCSRKEQKRGDIVNSKPENEFIQEEESNLYYYWKVLVRRKRVFIVIFLIPIAIVAGVSLLQPRYYLGERTIINPAIPPQTIISLVGDFDDAKKAEVFANTPGAIKSVRLFIPKRSNNRVNIILESNTADALPLAFQDIDQYICNLREFRDEDARIREHIDLQLQGLIEAKKANLFFYHQITNLMNTKKIIGINPADLITKDADLAVQIMNLQSEKATTSARGSLGPITVTKLPTTTQIMIQIICVGILSLFVGIFVVFVLLDYIDRMRTRENK